MELFLADNKILDISGSWEEMIRYLPEEERERILRFRNDPDRWRGTAGKILTRGAAARTFPGRKLVFQKTASEKPYLKEPEGFSFNLSHSGELVALATDDRPIGVDVEQLDPGLKWKNFHRFFTEEEMRMVEEDPDPIRRFFQLWTIREAFGKREGVGIAVLEKELQADYEKGTIAFEGGIRYFRCFEIRDYWLTVCSDRPVSLSEIRCLTGEEWQTFLSLVRDSAS